MKKIAVIKSKAIVVKHGPVPRVFRNETETEELQQGQPAKIAQVRQEYSSRISELQDQIVTLNGKVGTQEDQIETLKGKVGTQEDEIVMLKGKVGTLQDKVSQFDQFMQEMKTRDNCDNSPVATITAGKRKGRQMSSDGGGSKCSRK